MKTLFFLTSFSLLFVNSDLSAEMVQMRACTSKSIKVNEGRFEVVASNPKNDANFPEDVIEVNIIRKDENSGSVEENMGAHYYSSAYGMVSIDIVVSHDGRHCLFLIARNEGRGPSATSLRLGIFNFNDGYLCEILEIPIGGYAGSGMKWEYAYQCVESETGWKIQLKLAEVPEETPKMVFIGPCIPVYKEIRVDIKNSAEVSVMAEMLEVNSGMIKGMKRLLQWFFGEDEEKEKSLLEEQKSKEGDGESKEKFFSLPIADAAFPMENIKQCQSGKNLIYEYQGKNGLSSLKV